MRPDQTTAKPILDRPMQDVVEKAEDYRLLCRRMTRGHYLATKRDQRMHTLLGIPVVVTTTIVGTAIFGTLSQQPTIALQITAGLLSMASAILASLQTFFKYSERAEKHRSAASNYASLFRELDLFKLRHTHSNGPDKTQAVKELEEIVVRINQLEKDSPDVPDSLYDQAVKKQGGQRGVRQIGERDRACQ